MSDITVSWTQLYPGVEHAIGANHGYSPKNVNILRIDLTNPHIELFTTPWNSLQPPQNGTPGGVQTTQFLQHHFDPLSMQAMFATNANYFDMANRSIAHGLLLSQGNMVMYPYSAQSPYGLIVTKGNYAVMGQSAILFDQFVNRMGSRGRLYPELQPWTAVAGNFYLVHGGVSVAPSPTNNGYAPASAARTAIGLSTAGSGTPKYLFLLTIDGVEHQGNCPGYGATLQDAADWLIEAGATEGFNLDGGGSTTMARISRQDPQAKLMNVPHDSETCDVVAERFVATSLAVIVKSSDKGQPQ